MAEVPAFEGWAILELMGHRRLAGYVREQTLAGAGFLRIDVPGKEGTLATQLYSPGALYCLTPTTEETARRVAALSRPEPVSQWEIPALPAPRGAAATPEPEDDDQEDLDLGGEDHEGEGGPRG